MFVSRDASLGGCKDGLVSVRCIYVFVVEAADELPEFRRIGVECGVVEYLFPFCVLFV